MKAQVLILDFGSQYTQLIARRIRELHFYAEIKPFSIEPVIFAEMSAGTVIFSGGPGSVYEESPPLPHKQILEHIIEKNIPLLGICYGMQVLVNYMGGKIAPCSQREFGNAQLNLLKLDSPLFKKLDKISSVWMSHGDELIRTPKNFEVLAKTETCKFAVIADQRKKLYGVQFHPEVYHTEKGSQILLNFCQAVSKLKAEWGMKDYSKNIIKNIKEEVKNDRVLLGVSGGVDSMVTAKLIHEAIGAQLTCIYVDNGLMRKNETEEVKQTFQEFLSIPLEVVDASDTFLRALENVIDPEEKRETIGRLFIEEFKEKTKELGEHQFLAQGTLYPDVIESVPTKGPSNTIKSHHNRVKEVLKLLKEGKMIEPLKELFKDEVRELGAELNIPRRILFRHPFPGPGLAVRIIGEVNKQRLDILREADAILIEELKHNRVKDSEQTYYDQIWQAFTIFLPINSVGVMGDKRTYENVIIIRCVESLDGMTADFAKIPHSLLGKIASRIINNILGINRVAYDISSKPPATIEWE